MSGSLIPNGKQQYLDANGNPLASGKVYYYIPSTTTFKNTYQDAALTTLNTNPVVLDSAGECIAYGTGSYRQQVYDVNNNLIWDVQTNAPITLDQVEAVYSAPTGATLIGYNEGNSNATNRTVASKLLESVSVLDFGADPSGVTDSTTAIQNAVNSSKGMVHFPQGSYLISTPIQLPAGIIVYGDSAGQFNSIGTTITNNQVGGGCFWMTTNTSSAQVDGATISNFNLFADYPIMLNNPTTFIADGGSSPEPYYTKPKIDNCYIQARVSGTGTGISFSKCFDFEIFRCLVQNFNIGILLQGSDIGWVQNNRIVNSYTYQILEISTGTFGSQTEIRNNDILSG